MHDDLSIRLIGTPLLVCGDRTQRLERRDAALLALLAIEGTTDRSPLARLLWPDLPDPLARSHLRQRLFRLKTTAGRDVVCGRGALTLASDVHVDLHDFEAMVGVDPAFGGGELLAGLDYSDVDTLDQWVAAARHRWRSRTIDILGRLASELEADREYATALRYAIRLTLDDPTLEQAHRRVMRLHYLRGDRPAALDAFARCEAVLAREVGVEPDDETRELRALVASVPSRTFAPMPKPAALRRPPRMIGRDDVWTTLERACGDGVVVWLSGEAGMGKTRLLEEIVQATPGVLLFGARLGDTDTAWSSVGGLIDALVARFGPPADAAVAAELSRIARCLPPQARGALERERLADTVATAFEGWCSAGLTGVCLDDLHYADEASLELLLTIWQTAPSGRSNWIVAARPATWTSATCERIAAAEGKVLSTIDLQPLDDAAVAQLLDSLMIDGLQGDRWASGLSRHTGGNPFFLLETLLALLDRKGRLPGVVPVVLPLPGRVGALIDQRLARLGPTAAMLVRVAVVAGIDFDVALAAAVVGGPADGLFEAWRELEDAYVMTGRGFTHDLVAEQARRVIPDGVATTLHREIALALEARPIPPLRCAEHWLAAAAWDRAGAAFGRAALEARARARRLEEISLWQRCATCYARAGDHDLAFDARCESADAIYAERPGDDVLSMTSALCSEARSSTQRLDAFLRHALALFAAERLDEALAVAEKAATIATETDQPWKRFEAACLAAPCLARLERAGEGVRLLARFDELVAGADPRRRLDHASNSAYVLALAGKRLAATRRYEEACRLAERQGDDSEALVLYANLASITGLLGQAKTAAAHSTKSLALLASMGTVRNHAAAIALINAAAAYIDIGWFSEALSACGEAGELLASGAPGPAITVCRSHQASILLRLGRPDHARPLLRSGVDSTGVSLTAALRQATIAARIDGMAGSGLAAVLQRAEEATGELSDHKLYYIARLDAARIEPASMALRGCADVREAAEREEMLGCAMRARVVEIEVLSRSGQTRKAADRAAATWPQMQDCRPSDLYWAEALWVLVRALEGGRRSAHRDLASELLARAEQWVRTIERTHVPIEFRTSFVRDNEVNRTLLAMAARKSVCPGRMDRTLVTPQ